MALNYKSVSGLLSGKTVVVGVTGSIAAYKAAEIVRLFKKRSADVRVILTANAREFVGRTTFQALSGNRVYVSQFNDESRDMLDHINLAKRADITVIAPATANIIGKYASGIADDFLSTFLLATKTPVLMAPAMNPAMYRHQAVQNNIQILEERGVFWVGPDSGETACGDNGKGKLAPPESIVDHAAAILGKNGKFRGTKVLVTAGPTREFIDPVRFISNRSSGLMGYSMAAAAVEKGAGVILISGPTGIEPHAGVSFIQVESAEEMKDAVLAHVPQAQLVIMAAAVSDWRPRNVMKNKWKKSGMEQSLDLIANADILHILGARKNNKQILMGFAAETELLVEHALEKMEKKNLDYIFVNDVSGKHTGFSVPDNSGTLILKDGSRIDFPAMPKRLLADKILDHISL